MSPQSAQAQAVPSSSQDYHSTRSSATLPAPPVASSRSIQFLGRTARLTPGEPNISSSQPVISISTQSSKRRVVKLAHSIETASVVDSATKFSDSILSSPNPVHTTTRASLALAAGQPSVEDLCQPASQAAAAFWMHRQPRFAKDFFIVLSSSESEEGDDAG